MLKLMKLWLAMLMLAVPLHAAEINDFDITDANNTGRWPEGMSFASVNDAGRADEGIFARFYKDVNGSITTTGSANAYVISANQTFTAYYAGMWVRAKANFTNTAAATLNVDALGVKSISNVGASGIVSGRIYDFVYDGTNFQAIGQAAELPTGTKLVFFQATCPAGWTQDATQNNKALRIVSGTGAGTGGSQPFTTAFASQTPTGTTDGTAITVAQMPVHDHFLANGDTTQTALSAANRLGVNANFGNSNAYILSGTATAPTLGISSSTGSGATHTHTFTGNAINMAVQYMDVIVCTRN